MENEKMADRKVTASGKDKDGDIIKLCKSGEAWSPRMKADAIRDIENGTHTYYVQQAGTSPCRHHRGERNDRQIPSFDRR